MLNSYKSHISSNQFLLSFLVLFQGAILQSGSLLFSGRSNNAREIAFQVGQAVDKQFSSNDSIELLKVLQEASAQDIYDVSASNYMLI